MKPLGNLEKQILKWIKDVPQLPGVARKWLGDNVWWIVLVGAIVAGISALVSLVRLLSFASELSTIGATFYAVSSVTSWGLTAGFISLAFLVVEAVLLFSAVKPLQLKQKKGWVLLFAAWLFAIVSMVVDAALSLNIFNFILDLIFGAILLAVLGYFLFEIHGQFAHLEKSKGVKAKKEA